MHYSFALCSHGAETGAGLSGWEDGETLGGLLSLAGDAVQDSPLFAFLAKRIPPFQVLLPAWAFGTSPGGGGWL